MRLQAEIFQVKARIAANSKSIGKVRNAELGYFSRKIVFHELIRGSLNIYLIDWFDSPKYWNSDYKTPDNAPADYVVLVSKREGDFVPPVEEPRLVSDDEEFLFDTSTRVVGPVEGMELETKVWKSKDGLTLKECGPLDYKPYFDDYSDVKWKDKVVIRVLEVNHDEQKFRCELVSKNNP